MLKRKYYYRTRFPTRVILEAHSEFLSRLDSEEGIGSPSTSVRSNGEEWEYDSLEELIAEYQRARHYSLDHIAQGNRLIVRGVLPPCMCL